MDTAAAILVEELDRAGQQQCRLLGTAARTSDALIFCALVAADMAAWLRAGLGLATALIG